MVVPEDLVRAVGQSGERRLGRGDGGLAVVALERQNGEVDVREGIVGKVSGRLDQDLLAPAKITPPVGEHDSEFDPRG